MSATIITLIRDGITKYQIELSDEDATTEAISQAVIDIVSSTMSMSVGDHRKVLGNRT